VSAELGKATARAILTVTPAARDALTITKAEYDGSKRELRVEEAGTNAAATVHAFDAGTGRTARHLARVEAVDPGRR
jgi:hypothetical protein